MKRFFTLICILLSASFVKAADKLEKITNMNEFGYFTDTYYLHPQPELIDSAIKFLGSSGLASKPNAKAPLLMSFSCLFSKYDSAQKAMWAESIQSIEEPAKSLLARSMEKAPSELLGATPISAAKNDMNWACFFATGDLQYLNGVIFVLKYLEERDDINLFLTAASAKWSLSANAKSHLQVRMAMEAMKVGDVRAMRSIAADILTKDPNKIQEETVAILKLQKEKGAWK